MFNKSIAYRLSIYISLAVISVFLAFIVFAFLFNSSILKSNIENKATALGWQAMMMGEKQLVSTREITSNVADQILYFAQHDDVELFISKLMSKYHFLNAIHISIDSVVPDISIHNYYFFKEPDNISVVKKNQKIYPCVVEKNIFEKIQKKGVSGWTEVFKCHRNNKQVVSYYTPIRIRNEKNEMVTVGSVITELSLRELNDSINSLKLGINDYAFLISKDGTYLTHPDEDFILKKNIFEIGDKEYRSSDEITSEAIRKGESGVDIAYPEYMNFEKCWIHFTKINETGWTLFFVVPYKELFVPLYLLILRMLFFSVLGILVIFFIVTYISNKLIKPLSSVTTQLKEFSSATGEFELNTFNEVKLVSESLDYLQSMYEKFKIERTEEEKLNSNRKQDLEEASEIQMSLINTDFSPFSSRIDLDLFAIYKPVRIVSGDLFDFIFLDKDNLFFTIGDVSGKGLSAAFFMSVAQTLLKNNSKLKSPCKIVAATNNELYTVNQHQFFLTLFCGILNLKSGLLKYCNAAHTSTLILSTKGELAELEQSHGMPLGLYPNRIYNESSVKLTPGDSVILHSDGVTEQQNTSNQIFGNDRFYKVLRGLSKLNPEMLIKKIENNLDSFKGEAEQTDDITLMVLKFKAKKKA